MSDERWAAGWMPLPRIHFSPLEAGGSAFWHTRRVFSEYEAWLYLWSTAAYGEREWSIGVRKIQLEVGETTPLALRTLMREWGWKSLKRVHAFIHELIDCGEIREGKTTKNGNTYVFINASLKKAQGNAKETLGERKGNAGETIVKKERTKERKSMRRGAPVYTDDFVRAWDALPRRSGDSKPAAFRTFSARIKEGADPEAIIAGAALYNIHCEAEGKTGTDFVKQAQTFFGPGRWWEATYEHRNGNGKHPDPAEVKATADRISARSTEGDEPLPWL